jgi:penicillin-binding protein 1C
VISAASAFLVGDILSDTQSRSLTFGMDSPLTLPFWAAAKTGTSKDMRDNWCVGFSSRYTVGVWTGNFSGEPMWNVTGISGAAPAWAEIMQGLHRTGRDVSPHPPPGVVRVDGEWYLRGTEPTVQWARVPARTQQGPRIVYPVEGMIVARDPDIPADRQRIFFQSATSDPTLQWILNGQPLGPADAAYPWKPGPAGSYTLQLARAGQAVATVHFSVRGGTLAGDQEPTDSEEGR